MGSGQLPGCRMRCDERVPCSPVDASLAGTCDATGVSGWLKYPELSQPTQKINEGPLSGSVERGMAGCPMLSPASLCPARPPESPAKIPLRVHTDEYKSALSILCPTLHLSSLWPHVSFETMLLSSWFSCAFEMRSTFRNLAHSQKVTLQVNAWPKKSLLKGQGRTSK